MREAPLIAYLTLVVSRAISSVLEELKRVVKLVIDHRGLRTVLIREYVFRAAKRFTPIIAVECDGITFLVSTSDDVIGRITFAYRGFDEPAMHRLVGVLAEHTGVAQPLAGKTILDVGGNIGTTSIYAVRRFGAAAAIAFEPEPANLGLLRQNVGLNELADSIRVEPIALSDADGTVAFEISAEDGGDNRVRVGEAAGTMGEQDRRVIDVPARRLDALIADGTVSLDGVAMMWVDVQGHEAHVLSGALEVLRAGIPVSIEYWPYGLERAGGLDRLHALIAEHCATVVDLGPPAAESAPRTLAAKDIAQLARQYTGEFGFSDLLLFP